MKRLLPFLFVLLLFGLPFVWPRDDARAQGSGDKDAAPGKDDVPARPDEKKPDAPQGGPKPDDAKPNDSAPEKETPDEKTPDDGLTPEQREIVAKLDEVLNMPGGGFWAPGVVKQLYDAGGRGDMLRIPEVINIVNRRTWSWGADKAKERANNWLPLELPAADTPYADYVRAQIFRGLMGQGKRFRALQLWKQSENTSGGPLTVFALGFAESSEPKDRLKGVQLAAKAYQASLEEAREEAPEIETPDPAATAQMAQVLSDNARTQLAYCLVRAGGAAALDETLNPLLAEQVSSAIRFRLKETKGFESTSGGRPVCLADYDGDGFVDVLSSGCGLFRNVGGSGAFERVDGKLGIDIAGINSAFADVNNDGRIDIITAKKDALLVFLQDDKGAFALAEKPTKVEVFFPWGIGLFDGDMDGFIDVYLGSYEVPSESRSVGTLDVVLRNRGDGSFEDVTKAWGFIQDEPPLAAKGVSPADYDGDGRTDVYVSNYRLHRNYLWRNVGDSEKRAARFRECSRAPWFGDGEAPVVDEKALDQGVAGRQTPTDIVADPYGRSVRGHTSGSAWGDLDGDGRLDLVCANLAHPRFVTQGFSDLSRVYLNTGSGFADHTIAADLTFSEVTVDALIADFDNDGNLDLNLCNGYSTCVNQLYVGLGDGSFKETTWASGAIMMHCRGVAAGDFDNDGDLDLFVSDGNRGLLLYENILIDKGKIPEDGNFIQLKLSGLGSNAVNATAYGARVTVRAGDRVHVREVFGGRGNCNCDDPVVHVGLGEWKKPVDVTVRWIGEHTSRLDKLAVNTRHKIQWKDDVRLREDAPEPKGR